MLTGLLIIIGLVAITYPVYKLVLYTLKQRQLERLLRWDYLVRSGEVKRVFHPSNQWGIRVGEGGPELKVAVPLNEDGYRYIIGSIDKCY